MLPGSLFTLIYMTNGCALLLLMPYEGCNNSTNSSLYYIPSYLKTLKKCAIHDHERISLPETFYLRSLDSTVFFLLFERTYIVPHLIFFCACSLTHYTISDPYILSLLFPKTYSHSCRVPLFM